MAKTVTITVQLNDATLQGRRSLKLSSSTCRLAIVPRSLMKETLANPKLNEVMPEQDGDYYKLKADIELLKSSRSDSASFCTGVSTNGNIGWVDSRGRSFKEVFPK